VSALVVLAVLVGIAVLAPLLGVDSRWEGAGLRPDQPARGRRRAARPVRAARTAERPADRGTDRDATRAAARLRDVWESHPAAGSGPPAT